ncbi:(2Fe-2S)-binding protein [Teredinibacter sp. KSP-S5-2]|uniref:(2Fe-2S)-binding protein n=1 Tax=Teredinibacter sp. KSP-S5-2 TaxID=3034506 RepID=UPI002934871F|nr:2Fe-2S iron-sulfur cluster-binding protein [Teredinibacter sp. KSP-S5-2]WNO11230.1 (2Fe-2S)-binding protein [Teredinibacter sp. KSP-S5-2]
MIPISFTLNGSVVKVVAPPDKPLLWVLRDDLNLTGTKYSCGKGLCGACTIHLNGEAVRSCSLPVSAAANASITTIEGLSGHTANELKQAWDTFNVPQCGYCQPGQLMSASALLDKVQKPTDEQIDQAMKGNLCRCGTYQRIKSAIRHVTE